MARNVQPWLRCLRGAVARRARKAGSCFWDGGVFKYACLCGPRPLARRWARRRRRGTTMHVPGFAIDLIRLGVWLALIMVVFVPLERLFAARRQAVARPGFLTDIGWYFLSNMVPKLLLVLPVSAVAWAAHRAMPSPYYAWLAALPLWVRLSAAMVVGETGYYWAHRAGCTACPICGGSMPSITAPRTWISWSIRGPIRWTAFSDGFAGWCRCMCWGWRSRWETGWIMVPVLFALIGGLWGFLRARQCVVAVRLAGISDCHAGVSSLAPHQRRGGVAGQELRLDAALARLVFRVVPSAAARCRSRMASTRRWRRIWRGSCCIRGWGRPRRLGPPPRWRRRRFNRAVRPGPAAGRTAAREPKTKRHGTSRRAASSCRRAVRPGARRSFRQDLPGWVSTMWRAARIEAWVMVSW